VFVSHDNSNNNKMQKKKKKKEKLPEGKGEAIENLFS